MASRTIQMNCCQMEYYCWKIHAGGVLISMSQSIKWIILSFAAVLMLSGASQADEATSGQTEGEVAGSQDKQTALITITDPEIAAADDEEPDCE